ncbi:MAG: helix-turn-helix domain-containing protein [Chitinophagaceae bacterium]
MEIHIRNMVCDRCIKSVAGIFRQTGIETGDIRLGLVDATGELTEEKEKEIKELLLAEGFEWLDDHKVKLVERIKQEIVQRVHYSDLDEMKVNLSAHLADKLLKDYHYLSSTFSSIENTTIEQYFILQKIEKVKEWLIYKEYTLSEMAFRLGYSSVAHLSSQFKKITGFTPRQFKALKFHPRKPLDKI